MIYFLQENNEILHKAGFQIEQPEEAHYILTKPYIDFSSQAKKDWFDLHIMIKIGAIEFPFIALRNHLIHGKKNLQTCQRTVIFDPTKLVREIPWISYTFKY